MISLICNDLRVHMKVAEQCTSLHFLWNQSCFFFIWRLEWHKENSLFSGSLPHSKLFFHSWVFIWDIHQWFFRWSPFRFIVCLLIISKYNISLDTIVIKMKLAHIYAIHNIRGGGVSMCTSIFENTDPATFNRVEKACGGLRNLDIKKITPPSIWNPNPVTA